MAEVVFSEVAESTHLQGTLFQGIKFWLSQKVPQRSRFISDIRANGGEVLPLEKHANVKIVDHARKEAQPGTHSYTFIEESLRKGVLQRIDDHRVGPPEGTVRNAGSIIHPPKASRNKYTEEDDRILWNWLHDHVQQQGGTKGNEIYKQLELKYPQHPWQSWRDRWIRNFEGRPCPFPLPHNAPPTPPSDPSAAAAHSNQPQANSRSREVNFEQFSTADAEWLIRHGDDIESVLPQNVDDAWDQWASNDIVKDRPARIWRAYWEEKVRPEYLKAKAKQTAEDQSLAATESETPVKAENTNFLAASTISPSLENPSPSAGRQRSLSNYPESPSHQLLDSSVPQSRQIQNNFTARAVDSSRPASSSPARTSLANRPKHDAIRKRKRAQADEEIEIPSSSPLDATASPKRRRGSVSNFPREIPSTPGRSPVRKMENPRSPVLIKDEDDSDGIERREEDGSPHGQQLSETLSEPDREGFDMQAVLQEALKPIKLETSPQHRGWGEFQSSRRNISNSPVDFDFPSPVGHWDDQRRSPTQQVDLEVPPPPEGWDDHRRSPTQQIDLEVPPPPEGWDNEDPMAEVSAESESESESGSATTEVYNPLPMISETQAILRNKTQTPDFEVADPEGGWDDFVPSSQTARSSSPYAESQFSDGGAQMEAWTAVHIAKGFSTEQLVSAMKSTSMDTELAEEALRYIARKGKLPQNMKGVWTEIDDQDLTSTDARLVQRLIDKHGEYLAPRRDFLNYYNSLESD